MDIEAFIRARFRSEDDLEAFLDLFLQETGEEPLNVDRASLLVEAVLPFMHQDVLEAFLRQKDVEFLGNGTDEDAY